jgi:hypothetical protein
LKSGCAAVYFSKADCRNFRGGGIQKSDKVRQPASPPLALFNLSSQGCVVMCASPSARCGSLLGYHTNRAPSGGRLRTTLEKLAVEPVDAMLIAAARETIAANRTALQLFA